MLIRAGMMRFGATSVLSSNDVSVPPAVYHIQG